MILSGTSSSSSWLTEFGFDNYASGAIQIHICFTLLYFTLYYFMWHYNCLNKIASTWPHLRFDVGLEDSIVYHSNDSQWY